MRYMVNHCHPAIVANGKLLAAGTIVQERIYPVMVLHVACVSVHLCVCVCACGVRCVHVYVQKKSIVNSQLSQDLFTREGLLQGSIV